MIIDMQTLSATATYHLMTQTVIPRPIAWVLTQNNVGQSYNLAPFSYFTAVASDPALLMISFATKDEQGTQKDSLQNILQQQHFIVHIADSEQMQAVQDSATPLPYGESELTLANQHVVDFEGTSFKRLQHAPVAFACKLYEQQTIGNNAQHLIFGEITHVYIRDDSVNIDRKKMLIDAKKVNPLARLGLGQFCDIEQIRRPKFIK